VFEGGLRARALISVLAVLRSSKLGWQQQQQKFDPYRSKVAEEMLLCEVIVQNRICLKHQEGSAYEGAMQQDCEKLLLSARQLPTDCRYQARLCFDLRPHEQTWYG
jgi:hypothetical protein